MTTIRQAPRPRARELAGEAWDRDRRQPARRMSDGKPRKRFFRASASLSGGWTDGVFGSATSCVFLVRALS